MKKKGKGKKFVANEPPLSDSRNRVMTEAEFNRKQAQAKERETEETEPFSEMNSKPLGLEAFLAEDFKEMEQDAPAVPEQVLLKFTRNQDKLNQLKGLPDGSFWSTIMFNNAVLLCLDSFLTFAAPWSPRMKENSQVEEVYDVVFQIFERMTRPPSNLPRDSVETVLVLFYENWCFDTAKMLDLVTIYGQKNSERLKKMIEEVFRIEPAYHAEFSEYLTIFTQRFLNEIVSVFYEELKYHEELRGKPGSSLSLEAMKPVLKNLKVIWDVVSSCQRVASFFPKECIWRMFGSMKTLKILEETYLLAKLSVKTWIIPVEAKPFVLGLFEDLLTSIKITFGCVFETALKTEQILRTNPKNQEPPEKFLKELFSFLSKAGNSITVPRGTNGKNYHLIVEIVQGMGAQIFDFMEGIPASLVDSSEREVLLGSLLSLMDLKESQIEELFKGDGKELTRPVLEIEETRRQQTMDPAIREDEELRNAIKEIDQKTDEASGANYIPSETIEIVKKYKKPDKVVRNREKKAFQTINDMSQEEKSDYMKYILAANANQEDEYDDTLDIYEEANRPKLERDESEHLDRNSDDEEDILAKAKEEESKATKMGKYGLSQWAQSQSRYDKNKGNSGNSRNEFKKFKEYQKLDKRGELPPPPAQYSDEEDNEYPKEARVKVVYELKPALEAPPAPEASLPPKEPYKSKEFMDKQRLNKRDYHNRNRTSEKGRKKERAQHEKGENKGRGGANH